MNGKGASRTDESFVAFSHRFVVDSFVALDFIRLAPSVPGLRGAVWRTTPNGYKDWEVEFSFKAHGQSYLGGKGLAFWYTKERAVEGPIFGNKDQWDGLGVFMDTSDPANQVLAQHQLCLSSRLTSNNIQARSKHSGQ